MRTVVVTGAKGFIGKNLVKRLSTRETVQVLEIDIDNTEEQLALSIERADFVFHLAGVNRPESPEEFDTGNRLYTESLLQTIEHRKRSIPVLITSSTQAALDNPYGRSKSKAEAAVFAYGRNNNIGTYVFRLSNVFGKWCRPNYNSVVATWCYNSVNGLPLSVSDSEHTLSLVYIDDVIDAFLEALDGKLDSHTGSYLSIPVIYEKKLGEIKELIEQFTANRISRELPPFSDEFVRKLYATWSSYLPSGEFSYQLDMKFDERGWLAEFIKMRTFGQVFVSRTKPGITRGNHWHHTKAEKFLVVSGHGMVRFRKLGTDTIEEYPVSGDDLQVVDIPVGYTHSIENTGNDDMITIFWAGEVFDAQKPDTYYEEVIS